MRLRFTGRLLALVPLLAGCGSDEAPKTAPRPAGDEVRQDVLTRCRALGERLCAAADACCSSHGDNDESACVQRWLETTCSPAASVVAEGLAVYDDSAVEPCFEAQAAAFATCDGDWQEIVAHRQAIWSSCKVIRGSREPGQPCDTSALCAPPDGPATVSCVGSTCRVREFLAEGAECPYPQGDVSTCATGLYCTAVVQEETGICLAATPLDAPCNPILQNPECGLGNFCDLEAGVCRPATNFGGPTCDQGTECVSFVCDRVARECDAPPSLASRYCVFEDD
jgi:hypothetical protein